MKIKTLVVGPVQTDCYIAYDPETKDAFVVDPGDEAEKILAFLRENELRVTHILLTHSHFDHVLALAEVQAATGAVVCIHEAERENVEAPEHREMRPLGLLPMHGAPVKVGRALRDGDTLTLLGRTFTVLHTPGHTVGSVCYDDGQVLFSGDTLFEGDCGRTDLPGGSMAQMHASLRRLAALEGDRRVYPGHDVSTTLDAERRSNFDMLRACRAE